MANYTPTFTKPYPNGWVDKPSKTTPATAAIMNSYDTAIAALESYLRDNAIDAVSVSVEQFPSDGRQWIGTITVGSDQYRIYMPSLKYENSVSDGIKIGTITLGEQSFDVYAPTSSSGGSTVSVVPKTLTGTNIAEITVDGTTYQLYAPTGGCSGSTVTAEATLTEGTQIGKITIDGIETILYAPTASTITVDSELSATSENAIQNKAVDAAVKNLQQQIDAGGTGGSITVDSALSTTSVNPVQNKVVTAELNKKIETLDDESQAPDAVNFDLDSELSLTSVKGVQNKAIAEEFQKYANGTKVVAKATEANTATIASNAEKVNGHTVGTDVPSNAVFTDTVYDDSTVKASIQNIVNGTTQVGSAAKATQDAKGNVIDTTYAKKTEIPQGTVVDDALSSTSTNPVQNKVVKAEFDRVNSNLDDLKFGEVAGGKNLLDPNYFTSQIVKAGGTGNVDGVSWDCNIVNTFIEDLSGLQFKENTVYTIVLYGKCKNSEQLISNLNIEYTDGTKSIIMFSSKNTNSLALRVTNSNKTISKLAFYYGSIGTYLDPKKCGIFEGTIKESDFEPYIPSVNMLADEVSALEDYGLKADKPELIQGFYDISNDGIYKEDNVFICNKNAISCESVDKITVITGKEYYCRMVFYNENTFVSSEVNSVKSKKNVYVVPENVTKANFYFAKGDGNAFSLSELGYYSVYHNNAIDEIKNDLSNIKDGTTPAAKAVADEDGNNIKSTYAKKTETFEIVTEDVNVVLNSDLFDSVYNSNITCIRIGKLCVLSFTIHAKNTIYSTTDEIVLMTIVGTKYRPKKPDVNSSRQTFQGFAVGNYDENGKQSQSKNNTVRIITSSDSNYTEIITRDKDRINWNGYVQGQIMWVTD